MTVDEMVAAGITHEIHTSERKSFRGCRRRWDWIFRQNYYPQVTAKPLEFGIAYHKAMEVLHNPRTWKYTPVVLGALAEKAFVDTCERQRKAFLHQQGQQGLDVQDSLDYDERIELGRGMIWYYVDNQLAEMQAKYVPVLTEISFDVPLSYEDGSQIFCKCKQCRTKFAKAGGSKKNGPWRGNPVVISGRIDLVVHDMRGDYWLWDWKTAAQLSTSEIFLELDDQVATYCMAIRKKLNLNIRGFLYHEQRKAFPQPPKENKARRLGRLFSVNVNQATDYDTYLATVKEKDFNAWQEGAYDDFLNLLKAAAETEGAGFYRRFTIIKTPYELDQVEINLREEVLDIIDPHLRIYPSPGRFSCNTCAFQTPCISQNAGQDYQYTLDTLYEKKAAYYTLQKLEASTESRGRAA